jgi:predicted GIY-YIG superfamily endonuclease
MAKPDYFYYFIDSSGLYYGGITGGITDSIKTRQRKHRSDHKNGRKSNSKDWELLQDPITLIPVWTFETRKEAAAYEKQWIIRNYQNPLCLNCSVSNSEYDYENHRELCLKGKSREELRELCEAGGGPKAVPLFLICTKTGLITKIESSYEGERLGLGPQQNLSGYSKPNCLNRVKTCLVATSETAAKAKLEAWLLIPGNDTIDNPIILELPEGTKQSALWKLANVNRSSFSSMYREVLNPNTGEPLRYAMQSKADFNWYGTKVEQGSWFRCTKSSG